ncbi:type II toxin-antitoxin system Phd/YefM family antitoxin [Brevundimonas sp.]|uniref:type II toxin-antitoxin system Phd/YefM family antitoxin n=1 Tax=Brevundimonas sp. TaxID=1871086 RepID=UPI00391DC9EB
MREVGILEAKTGLSGLVADVERTGEEIVLTRHGRAAAKLVPVSQPRRRDPAEWKKTVAAILATRDARPVVPGFDDLSWDELKRIARDEDRYD